MRGLFRIGIRRALQRGLGLFQIACAPCHGMNGVKTINPQARPFAVEKFQNGGDPYSVFKTITRGFKNMPLQILDDAGAAIRGHPIYPRNFCQETQSNSVHESGSSLSGFASRFDPGLAMLSAAATKVRQCDFGPVLESQLGTNCSDALTFRLRDNVSLSYDLHRMRLAARGRAALISRAPVMLNNAARGRSPLTASCCRACSSGVGLSADALIIPPTTFRAGRCQPVDELTKATMFIIDRRSCRLRLRTQMLDCLDAEETTNLLWFRTR